MNPYDRRMVHGDSVAVCPHCGTDSRPVKVCKVHEAYFTCSACHHTVTVAHLVRVNSWRDPETWRQPRALQLVQATLPNVNAVLVNALRGFRLPARTDQLTIAVGMDVTPPMRESGIDQLTDYVKVDVSTDPPTVLTAKYASRP